jgi:hypothetical protein
VFVPDKRFKPSLIFESNAGAYQSGAVPTMIANIKLARKNFQGKNSLAYDEERKYYIGTWGLYYKTFYSTNLGCTVAYYAEERKYYYIDK